MMGLASLPSGVGWLRAELALVPIAGTAVLFFVFGQDWLGDLSNRLWLGLMFVWLFAVVLWAAIRVVRHADSLALKLGEPYGTLILTLSAISIEVVMISAMMLTGENNPTLARDTMYAVIMIVLNGMVGMTLVMGALRYREQTYNLDGARAYLGVIIFAAYRRHLGRVAAGRRPAAASRWCAPGRHTGQCLTFSAVASRSPEAMVDCTGRYTARWAG